jgi:hypothetical protein
MHTAHSPSSIYLIVSFSTYRPCWVLVSAYPPMCVRRMEGCNDGRSLWECAGGFGKQAAMRRMDVGHDPANPNPLERQVLATKAASVCRAGGPVRSAVLTRGRLD